MLKTCIILAGGFGTRLQSVVKEVPKPLAPVCEKPFLDYLLLYLAYYGVEKIIFSTGYLAEKIEAHYANYAGSLELVFSHEASPLGTGGAIRLAMQHCEEANVLVINGDSFLDVDLQAYTERHFQTKAEASLAVRKVENAARYGTILTDETGRILSFQEKTGVAEAGIINGGVYILKKDLYLHSCPSEGAFSIEKEFFESLCHIFHFQTWTSEGYFIDIGIPEDYQQAQSDFLNFKYLKNS